MPEVNNSIPSYEEPPYDRLAESIKESEAKYRVFEENGGKMSVGDFEAWESNRDRHETLEEQQANKPKSLKSGSRAIQ